MFRLPMLVEPVFVIVKVYVEVWETPELVEDMEVVNVGLSAAFN